MRNWKGEEAGDGRLSQPTNTWTVRKITDQKPKQILEVVMQLRGFILLLALVLSACGESPAPAKGQSGEKGEQGPPGVPGRTSRTSRTGGPESGAVIRFVDWRMSAGMHCRMRGE